MVTVYQTELEKWARRHKSKLCRFCGCPMKPKGVKKKPNEYDHAQGCPYSRKRKVADEAGQKQRSR